MSNWMQDLFHVEKPIIAMCHLQPLPGDPYYDADGGMEKVMAAAKADLLALQEGAGLTELCSPMSSAFPTSQRWNLSR